MNLIMQSDGSTIMSVDLAMSRFFMSKYLPPVAECRKKRLSGLHI